MIVWRKKESKCARTGGSFARVLEVGCDKDIGVFITLNHCYKFKDDDEWKTSHVGELGFYFNPLLPFKKWKWGSEHFWYDGPHCTFWMGCCHINYLFDSGCKICESEISG